MKKTTKNSVQSKMSAMDIDRNIDMNRIYMIESSGNPNAWNKGEDARGLGQIRNIVLQEWNNFNTQKHTQDELFNPETNAKIADWYMNKRIPQMLRHFGVEDTPRNRIIAYNAGINYLVKQKNIPESTKKYISKYERK